jgi:hypothetical protein
MPGPVVSAILSDRRLSNTQTHVVRIDEPGFATKSKIAPLDLLKKIIPTKDPVLRDKLNALRLATYERSLDPTPLLLTNDEIERFQSYFNLRPDEVKQLQEAQSNLVAWAETLADPEAQSRAIHNIVTKLVQDKAAEPKDAASNLAYTALRSVLDIKMVRANEVTSQGNWETLHHNDDQEKRGEIFDEIMQELGLAESLDVATLKEFLLAEQHNGVLKAEKGISGARKIGGVCFWVGQVSGESRSHKKSVGPGK